ncbi:MAG: SUMF1/EgtB/PvdO family nonheme iron enzyme [Nannocystis sp.]|nr:SUMF1/EgtB/PvdO family nonheme iron enzyme [Nannocystis sp.]
MTRFDLATSTLLLLTAAATLCSCEQASGLYDRAEAPPSAPTPLPGVVARVDKEGRASSGISPEEAAKCGPATGRNPDGDCVGLGLWDTEFVQRVQIPGGRFVMGFVPDSYDARPARELPASSWSGQPPRYVDVASFWIDLHEVSRGAYAACVAAGACSPAICPEDAPDPAAGMSAEASALLPQTCVSRSQAGSYCAFAAGRLPTEAEWEYAARGPDARVFPWGSSVVDTLPPGLHPVGRIGEDRSYFGIMGMGINALEWVADAFDPDVGLRPFLTGPVRSPTGPMARARAAFEARLACGEPPAKGCAPPTEPPPRFLIKISLAGAHRAGRGTAPAFPPEKEMEAWRPEVVAPGPRVGLRCAADLVDGRDTPLTLPAATATIPFTRREEGLLIFGGVIEAVSLAEAQAFCAALAVPGPGDAPLTGWRLPTRAEVVTIARGFRGPGPFWAADGGVIQEDRTSDPGDEAPWVALEAGPEEALAARCVRE